MKIHRRKVISGGLATGSALLWGRSLGYTHEEIARMFHEKGSLQGVTRDDLSTPCLLVDLDRFESNIKKMSKHAREHSIGLRPHAKTHKCVEIARRQINLGALGICVATIAEAEVMARNGIKGLLITSELVGRPKIARLVKLIQSRADVMAVVDDPANVTELQEAAQAARIKIAVLLDVDVGTNRTGLQPGEPALRVAEKVGSSKNLVLKGIHAYAGQSSHVVGFEARKANSIESMSPAVQTAELLRKHGHNVELLSGGSTGTYNIDSDIEGISELQVGSYVFMDIDYRRIGGQSGSVYDDFAPALTVLTTVIHRSGDKAILDGGIKAFATDRAFGPEPKDLTGVKYSIAGDEHGKLLLENPSREIRLGDRIEMVIPHCDPNVNLYDRIYGLRGEKVETVWAVMDRMAVRPYF